MPLIELKTPVQRRAKDLVDSHGPSGAVRACETLVAKARNQRKLGTSPGMTSKLAHYRDQAAYWNAMLDAVKERIG